MTVSESDMTSWRLWRAVRHPPYKHPVFRRTMQARPMALPGSLRGLARVRPSWWLLLVGVTLLLILRPTLHALPLLIFTAPIALVLLFFLTPLLFPVVVMVQSAWWAASISQALVSEHKQQTYDILCLFPDGCLGVNWAMASGCMRRNLMFSALSVAARVLLLMGLVLLALLLLLLGPGIIADLTDDMITANDIAAFRTLLDILALMVAYALHYVQSIALGPIIGLLVPTYTHHRVEAQLGAIGLSLAVQVGSYLLFLAMVRGVIDPLLSGPLLSGLLPPDSWLASAVQPVLFLGLLLVIREGAVTGLWRLAIQRLNVHPDEADRVLHARRPARQRRGSGGPL